MKKTLLALALLALPVALFAQGTVQFNNSSPGTVVTTNSTATPPPGQVANQTGNTRGVNTYYFGLYIGNVGQDPTTFTMVGVATNASGVPVGSGTFNGNPSSGSF